MIEKIVLEKIKTTEMKMDRELDPKKLVFLRGRDRDAVQYDLINIMLGEKSDLKSQLKWVDDWSAIVSQIIDNPKNEELRKLIEEGENNSDYYFMAANAIRDRINEINDVNKITEIEPQINKAA
jgi:hypothetical protein